MHEATSTLEASTPTGVLIERDERSNSVRNGLLCALVVAVCVLLSDPFANMPFSDDFSYTKTALDFARTGHFLYNGWATAMLGWLVPWGALFIKLFGFSFTVVRLSMLPIDMVAVYLFHQILRRFGINPSNAILGALALGLSPLFMPLAASYMTDIPGLLILLVCIYMCQRAAAAASDRAALLWLCSAMVINVAGGTVRQIAWLGALVMVPSTAWLLRKRRGMKLAAVLLFAFSFFGVLACMHWFNLQPYSVPEHVIRAPIHIPVLIHLAAQLLKTFLCLLLVIFPVSVAWLPTANRLNRKGWMRLAGAIAVLASLAILLYRDTVFGGWLMPWLTFLLAAQWDILPDLLGVATNPATLWTRCILSLLVIVPALIFAEHRMRRKRDQPPGTDGRKSSWNQVAWILGPFSLSYVMLLAPRGAFFMIYDRYVLCLAPIAIVVLLLAYQERISERTSALSLIVLTLVGIVSIAGTHDFYAESRAMVRTLQMIQRSGAPRNSIQASLTMVGWAWDGWVQIAGGGHINGALIQVPAGAYDPNTPDLKLPEECTSWLASSTPAIVPKYFVVLSPMPCFAPAKYPPVHYTTWLPPFHRTLYVQQRKNISN